MILTPEQVEQYRKEKAERRDEFIQENSAEWEDSGAKFRAMRSTCRITLREMSNLTGFSASKLGDFELGHPVHNRDVIEKSYSMALRIKANQFIISINRLFAEIDAL